MASYAVVLFFLASQSVALSTHFTCYETTDCHGEAVDSIFERGDCCAGRGLSFGLEGDSRCQNCFNEEEFVSEGSEFYLAFFNNLQIGFFSQAKVMVRVSNVDVIPDTVEISYDSESRKIESGSTVEVELPTSLRLKDIGKSGKGVSIRSVNGAKLSVTAFGDELTSSDTYQLLPCVYLPSLYEYYAVSVAKVNIVVFDDGEELISEPLGNSVLVVIASEDNTHVTLTPTQDVFVEPDKETEAGESVDITLSRGETLFISSEDDLTGSHVVSDKPLAVFSGHECGNIPSNISYCDQMVEQIPPTATWGREFYATSFLTRRMDRFKAISSKETNTIRWSCTGGVSSSGSLDFSGAGVPVEFDIDSDQSCRFKSDYPILLVQFSVGSQADNILDADPSMTVIPPAKQYRNSYMLNYFIGLRLNSYLNIILLNTSDDISTSDTLFNGVNFEGNWTVIRCDDDSSDVCAYSIQLLAPESGTVAVSHSNPAAKLMGIPYALGLTTGRGSFSGMSQEPIALDVVTFDATTYSVIEGSGVVNVTLTRTGDLTDSVTIPFRARAMPNTTNAAEAGVDFHEVKEDVTFPAQTESINVSITLGPNDIFPGEDKVFEVYVGPTPGTYVSPTAYVTVIIVDPDPELPVMNISLGETNTSISEGIGFYEVRLLKSEGALGPVTVTLFTISGSATDDLDFEPLEMNITFDTSVTEKVVQILISNDDMVETTEMFTVNITAVDGLYPLKVLDSELRLDIIDNDRVLIGFQPAAVTVDEAAEVVEVTVELLNGTIAEDINLNLQLYSDNLTAHAGNDYERISERLVVFNSSVTSITVPVTILDDVIAEDWETFILHLGPKEGTSDVDVAPNRTYVTIADDDVVMVSMELVDSPSPVPESASSITVSVSVVGLDLDTEGDMLIRLGLSTVPITAKAYDDFEILSNSELLLRENDTTHTHRVSIDIYDNNQYDGELERLFNITMSVLESDFEWEIVSSPITVSITDNEEEPRADTVCSKIDQPIIRVSSPEECCVSQSGDYYQNNGIPIQCIVIGFESAEYRLVESTEPYSLVVRVSPEGSLAQNLTLTIIPTPISAAPPDYTVSNYVRLRRGVVENVTVALTFEPGSEEQSGETFRLDIIEESGITPKNVFFSGTEVVILKGEF